MTRTRSLPLPVLALALAGCPAEPPPAPPSIAPVASSAAPEQRARAAAQALGARLKARLEEALAAEGPAGAIRVCSQEAPALAAQVSAEQGLRVGRTSFRLRNPANAAPAWAAEWVAARTSEPRFAPGEGGGLRALLPITTAPLCLTCHGPADALGPDVRAALGERYPEDVATGFQAGELRGWFWVELPPD